MSVGVTLAPPAAVKSIFVCPTGSPSTSRFLTELSASTTVIGSPEAQFGWTDWLGGARLQLIVPTHSPKSSVSLGPPGIVTFHWPTPVIFRLVRSKFRLLPAPVVVSGCSTSPLTSTGWL